MCKLFYCKTCKWVAERPIESSLQVCKCGSELSFIEYTNEQFQLVYKWQKMFNVDHVDQFLLNAQILENTQQAFNEELNMIEEMKQHIGKMVMSRDPGNKLIRSIAPHGPYKLLKITKGGMAILEGYDRNVPLSLIELVKE